MGKTRELNNIKEIVKETLTSYPNTRNSDNALYIKVCERLNPEVLNKPFWFVLANMKNEHLPSIETVGRARRKVQEQNADLSAVEDVENERMLNEEIFRDFARSNA